MSVSEVTSRASQPPPPRRSRSRPARAATSIGGRFTRSSLPFWPADPTGNWWVLQARTQLSSSEEPADGLDGQWVAVAAEAAEPSGGAPGHPAGVGAPAPAVGG